MARFLGRPTTLMQACNRCLALGFTCINVGGYKLGILSNGLIRFKGGHGTFIIKEFYQINYYMAEDSVWSVSND